MCHFQRVSLFGYAEAHSAQKSQSLQTFKVAFRLAQEQSIESFIEYDSMAEKLQPSHTSSVQCKQSDAVV